MKERILQEKEDIYYRLEMIQRKIPQLIKYPCSWELLFPPRTLLLEERRKEGLDHHCLYSHSCIRCPEPRSLGTAQKQIADGTTDWNTQLLEERSERHLQEEVLMELGNRDTASERKPKCQKGKGGEALARWWDSGSSKELLVV
jgi:hypothetical protein